MRHALPALALAACGLAPYDLPGEDSGPVTGRSPRGDVRGDPGGTTGATTGEATGASGSDGASGDEGGPGPAFDLGALPEFAPALPAGCEGRKIDFIFLTSRAASMADDQPQYGASLSGIAEIIEAKFAGFDTHVLVANPDADWGDSACEDLYCIDGACGKAPGYPCGAMAGTSACDWELGAGVVFPAGEQATNHPCPLVAGRRYVVDAHPQKGAAFECMARLGSSGDQPRHGDALLAALGPGLNSPSGCNAGFLRDDAILVVTFVADTHDYSESQLLDWYEALVAARQGDLRSLVLLGILTDVGQPDAVCEQFYEGYPVLRELLDMVPNSVFASVCEPSYVPAFAEAADLALASCAAAIPE